MSPVFGLWQCFKIVELVFADDMYDVFLKKGIVFTKIEYDYWRIRPSISAGQGSVWHHWATVHEGYLQFS